MVVLESIFRADFDSGIYFEIHMSNFSQNGRQNSKMALFGHFDPPITRKVEKNEKIKYSVLKLNICLK